MWNQAAVGPVLDWTLGSWACTGLDLGWTMGNELVLAKPWATNKAVTRSVLGYTMWTQAGQWRQTRSVLG